MIDDGNKRKYFGSFRIRIKKISERFKIFDNSEGKLKILTHTYNKPMKFTQID